MTDKKMTVRGDKPLTHSQGEELIPVSVGSSVYITKGKLGKDKTRESTRKLYQSKLDKFERLGYTLPCFDNALINFIEDMATLNHFSTITGYVAAIKWYHRQNDLPTPDRFGLVKQALDELRRKKIEAGEQPHQATPMLNEDLQKISEYYSRKKGMLCIRNRAICMLMYYGSLRCSELVSIDVGRVRFDSRGMTITLPVSKNDKNIIRISRNKYEPELCAVDALEEFIRLHHVMSNRETPLFPSSHSSGRLKKGTRLPVNSVAELIRKAFYELGYEYVEDYSGHSPRRGYVTDAVHLNNNIIQIAAKARMSVGLVRRYAEVSTSHVSDDIMRKMARKRKRDQKD